MEHIIICLMACGPADVDWYEAAAKMPACQYDDSVGCYWDAASRGDGRGDSFISLETEDGTVTVVYEPVDGVAAVTTFPG